MLKYATAPLVAIMKYFEPYDDLNPSFKVNITGDCRGSHVMPLMPTAINTAVAGAFCLPLVSCLAFSMDAGGRFTSEYVDLFGNAVWDATRLKVQQKAEEWRQQGIPRDGLARRAGLH